MTQMILVGGFLGAGKTTLLARATKLLLAQGVRVGLITNDQADNLVDTASLRQGKFDVLEIAGGCFCCRFGQLIETAEQLVADFSPDVIIGEPVGSCTDLSATVLQPLKDLYAAKYRLAPFSVLVEPHRLWEVLEPRRQSALHASARYILRKQLEEADILVINKQELLDAAKRDELVDATRETFPDKPIRLISAVRGDGVDSWLATLMTEGNAGTHIVDVDYDIYAEGEAVLGWLNASATVTALAPVAWADFAFAILQGIQQAAVARQAEIAHVKLSLTAGGDQYVANLTSTGGTPAIHGCISGKPQRAALVLNARVEMSPEELQMLVEAVLHSVAGESLTVQVETMCSVSPGRPVPTYRYASVVEKSEE